MILELIICHLEICSSLLVLWQMETKFGIRLLHGKRYLCTKPGCSRTAKNMWPSLPAFVELINFCVTSQFHCTQAITTVVIACMQWNWGIYHNKIISDWRGLRQVYLSTLRKSVHRAIRVLLWGKNDCFRIVVMEEPWWNGSFDNIQWHSPLSN